MIVSKVQVIQITLTSHEAGILMHLLGLIGGSPQLPGRALTETLRDMLERQGVLAVEAFEPDSEIRAK